MLQVEDPSADGLEVQFLTATGSHSTRPSAAEAMEDAEGRAIQCSLRVTCLRARTGRWVVSGNPSADGLLSVSIPTHVGALTGDGAGSAIELRNH